MGCAIYIFYGGHFKVTFLSEVTILLAISLGGIIIQVLKLASEV